jgi:hypothetical protein
MSAEASYIAAITGSADSGSQNSQKNDAAAKVDPHFKNANFLATILAKNTGKLEVRHFSTYKFCYSSFSPSISSLYNGISP